MHLFNLLKIIYKNVHMYSTFLYGENIQNHDVHSKKTTLPHHNSADVVSVEYMCLCICMRGPQKVHGKYALQKCI